MDPTPAETRPPEVSGIFISIVTALAYAMAFAYEAGTAGAFGIPFEMIDLQLMPALFGMIVAFSVTLAFLRTLDLIVLPRIGLNRSDHPLLKELKLSLLSLGVGGILWLLARPVSWRWILAGLATVILFPAVEFAIWIKLWGRKDLLRRIREPFPEHSLFSGEGPIFTALISNSLAAKGLLLVMSIGLSAIAGLGVGQRQRDFFVTNLEPETIVLRIYGSRAVAAEFVRAEKRIKPVYRFLKLDEPGLTLRLERVGPITFTEGKATQ